jgi:hypothetical protein
MLINDQFFLKIAKLIIFQFVNKTNLKSINGWSVWKRVVLFSFLNLWLVVTLIQI